MSTLAYGLRAEYLEDGPSPFLGGLIRLDPDGRELDLADALASGDGTIVIDELDQPAALALDAVPALKRVTPPATTPASVSRYDGKTVADLRDECRLRGIRTSGNRDELVARLTAHDDALARGEQPGPDPTDGADLGVAGEPGTTTTTEGR